MAIALWRSVLRNIIKLTSEQWLIGRLDPALPFSREEWRTHTNTHKCMHICSLTEQSTHVETETHAHTHRQARASFVRLACAPCEPVTAVSLRFESRLQLQ